ncbi:MAG: hypothetical protein EOS72_03080 [Mesorhizobium sp.]|uniref:hypothetical protein n=1 Tax=Mesorhizobium sp. TaxID=1871066 RepID=UPI000FE5AA43|nr:hypothetical protein [Mesorhizobium sp.]RWC91653.1 MAG: hypothetical protein EOS72_03080 [Mesorhizobium sp.]
MSLIALATRVVLVRLLAGRTWAQDPVLDSPLDPIEEILRAANGQPKPVIAVYTSESKGKPVGLETQGGKQSVRTAVYVYLPPSKVTLPEGVAFEIDNVGSGLALSTMGRQIDAAMHLGNTPWLKIWRRFVTCIDEKTSRFVLVEVQSGVKIPCMEVIYELDCVADADFAKPLYGAWLDLDTLLRADGADTEGEMLANHIKSLIEKPEGLHPYEVFQANFGLMDAAYEATGLAPLAGSLDPDSGESPLLNSVDAPQQTEIVPPGQVP